MLVVRVARVWTSVHQQLNNWHQEKVLLRFKKPPHSYAEVLNQEILPPCSFSMNVLLLQMSTWHLIAGDKFYQAFPNISTTSHKQWVRRSVYKKLITPF